MWRLNQLSSSVHTVCTWSLQHCTNPRTSHQGWHTECVMAAFAWERDLLYEIILKQQWGQQARSACACVCEWLIMKQLELIKALHFKMISCCPCRWQQQCTHWCGQGKAAITRLDILVRQVVANIDSFSSFLSSDHIRNGFMWITQCLLHHNEDSLHSSFIWAL